MFDGSTVEYKCYVDLVLEVSPSNKASCKGCLQKIDKGILRWCSDYVNQYGQIYISKRYYHTQCLPDIAGNPIVEYNPKTQQGKLVERDLMPTKQVEKELFQTALKNYVKYRIQFDNKDKQKPNWKSDNDSDSEDEKPKKAAKKAQAVVKQEGKPANSNKRKVDHDSAIVDEDEDTNLDAYNDKQKQKYKQKYDEIKGKTIAQLKEMLKANHQIQSGNKEQLLVRVADGMTLGAIPQCTECGGGKLRFNQSTGQYTCPGYMEDTDKINCKASFKFNEVVRFDWVDV